MKLGPYQTCFLPIGRDDIFYVSETPWKTEVKNAILSVSTIIVINESVYFVIRSSSVWSNYRIEVTHNAI